MDSIIKFSNIWFKYESSHVLQDASLTINRGEYLGVIGPNGSSKSTLIKLILGMLPLQKGSIEIFGKSIDRFDEWHKIGYVAQKSNAFNSTFPATVEEVVGANLFHSIGLFKPIRKKHHQRVDDVLDIVGMKEFKKRLIGQLSGGQQQKVFIARALVSSPEIIFLDEPTVGIDTQSQLEFYDLLEKLNKEMGMTIVMVSHDIGVITEKVTRIACMADGAIVSHDACCAVPAVEFLEGVYGDHMKLMLHDHRHDVPKPVPLQEEV
jgi:zinc transport system ATP-binding protein